jgi:toxin ParE1/3/4
MRRYEVSFLAAARDDLLALFDYIADDAGLAVAIGYIERIEAACLDLETFPERGTRRDDIRIGLRTMGFERRATIVFQVADAEVLIVRVFYGGQDFEHALRG